MTRSEVRAHDLQIGDLAALVETGPYIFERVRNLYAYGDGTCVVRSTLTGHIVSWSPYTRVWVKR